MTMSLDQARVIDPILTTHARGYKHAERIGSLLFPSVQVEVSAGKVIEFGKEAFIRYNARRAPGADTKRIEFGYEGAPYSLAQDALESKVPREFARDAKIVPGTDLGMRATNTVMQSLTLGLEYEQATIATTAANYASDHKVTLSGTSQWTHADGKPVDDIEDARQVIRRSCGLYPNVLALGPIAYASLKNNAQVIGRFQNTDVITAKMLADLMEIDQVVEGRAVTANEAGEFADVWGNFAVLAYAPKQTNGFEEPSYGYTYTMRGHPYVEEPYWAQGVKSWIYGVTYERAPVLTGMSAGFLFTAPAAVE